MLWVDGPEEAAWVREALAKRRDGGAQIDLEDAMAAAPPNLEGLNSNELRELYRQLEADFQAGSRTLHRAMSRLRGGPARYAFDAEPVIRAGWKHSWKDLRHEAMSESLKKELTETIEDLRLEFADRGLEVEDPPPEESG